MPAILPSGLPTLLDPNTYTAGSSLWAYRQLVFGSYSFPLTCQTKTSSLKLAFDQKHIAFNIGDQVPENSGMAAREINIVGMVGTGLIGSSGSTLVTASDLEAERVALASQQAIGAQPLFIRWDRFMLARMTEFQFNPEQDYGEWRYATFDCKFIAPDPRSYGTTQRSHTGTVSGTTAVSFTATHNGNVNAYPVITITGLSSSGTSSGVGPFIGMSSGSSTQQITLSGLTLMGGDVLVINCDPRPEARSAAISYTPSGSSAQQGMGYVAPTDFIQQIDVSQFFPWIMPGAGNTFYVSCTSGGNFSVNVQWLDTYN